MGFRVLDALLMATRCGAVDPGAILYLARQGRSLSEIEDLLYRRSGLLGVSGISGDVRDPIGNPAIRAHEALALFSDRAAFEIGGLTSALGGLDGIAFTAGIGASASAIRSEICKRLSWLGVRFDESANANHARSSAPSTAMWKSVSSALMRR